MSIQKKILVYFSMVTILLTGMAFFFIYTLFYEYREEEFQQRQHEKISTTLKFLTEIKEVEVGLIQEMDRLTINDLYDEKLLIFDKDKNLIYSSIDDTPVPFSKDILSQLSFDNEWVEKKEGLYDVVGIYTRGSGGAYYAISKAYDYFGYSKLNYLRLVLILNFGGISVVVVLVSYYLSKKITHSITAVTQRIKNYDFDQPLVLMEEKSSTDEVAVFVRRFNELMARVNTAFAFQRHAIHHISHELKTPISVLVSNFERIEKTQDPEQLKKMIQLQKDNTKSLGDIINALLDIAKAQSGGLTKDEVIRVDELIFDTAMELSGVYPDFQFQVNYQEVQDENLLTIHANSRLLKSSIMNLMTNCIHYSDEHMATIIIGLIPEGLKIDFKNTGPIVDENEKPFLFRHFFRGKNSLGKRGFGLGLVFIHQIIQLHGGQVTYKATDNSHNCFTVTLPLR